MNYLTVPLHAQHKKGNFSCGKALLDNYLHTQAKQDIKRKLSTCFILEGEGHTVKGYYTLSSAAVLRELLPDTVRQKLPASYHNLPATLLGRLAIDNSCKGQGLGECLLIDALRRSYDVAVSSVGSMAVIVDPLDEDAIRFYKKYGFILLPDSGKMFIPMTTVIELF